ncbi:probable arginine--tRNA ligase, mitochondrial isoform X1, partial [Tachysurus ichikawai]
MHMASFFRRSISSELARICGGSEDVFIPLLSAVPVSKRQLTPDFRLTVVSLVQNGILSSGENLLCQTERLVTQLKVNSVIEDVTAGRNVITFRVNKKLLAQRVLTELHEDPQTFGLKSEILRALPRGRTLVEYSSPNIAKKFHAGHLRSTIIGERVNSFHSLIIIRIYS